MENFTLVQHNLKQRILYSLSTEKYLTKHNWISEKYKNSYYMQE
jgi:hypothetical protein